jgi:hypothetical protein
VTEREIPIDRQSTLRRGLTRLEQMGQVLREAEPERVDRAIAGAAAMLGDPRSPLGRQAREALPARAKLSPEMVDWALRTTLETITPGSLGAGREALARAVHPHRLVPARRHAMVLASNLFTASVKPIVWSLLCGAPVALKLSADDEGLPELFALALTLSDEEIGQCVLPTRFSRLDEPLTEALLSGADAISIFGGDHTVSTLLSLAPPSAEVIAHGHGLGVGFLSGSALTSDAVVGLAMDVAAYDQRGCLSPHAIFVAEGGALSPREVAARLADALAALARSLPRGALEVPHGARQVQWRRVSEALGELFEGDGYAVAFDGDGPVRACPLARNVAVHSVPDRDALRERLNGYGVHLKIVGGSELELPPPLCPRFVLPGAMQRPTLLDLHDGQHPWHGLFKLG